MAKRKDLGFQILSRVGRNGSGWLSDMQIHSPAHPELSLHLPALASPHHHPPPSLSCTVSSSPEEWRSHVTLSPCPFCPMLKKARPGPYLGVPSPNKAQDLCSGVLGVSPTLMVTGAPSPEKEAHVPQVPQATWQRAGKGRNFIGRSHQQLPAPGSFCHPSFPTRG